MAYRLACERSDLVAAVAPVAGGLAQEMMPRCPAGETRPTPLLLIHGTADPINRFDDGELEGNLWQWVERNGCRRPPELRYLPDTAPNDGTRTRVESYRNCRAGAEVTLYAVERGGHHWPGGDAPWGWRNNGREIRDFDAGAHVWDFFRRHPMSPEQPP
jgi:polyhydroxybutyrate depolymerase